MDRQQFLDRLKQLENADNDKLRNFLNRLLREGLSKKEIAKAAKVHISTISRRLKDTCEHFDIKVEHGGVHEDDLINLFRQFKPDFLHPSLLETTVNSEILNRPQLPNIPSPDHTQELTPLEFIGRDRHQTLTNPQNIPTPDRTHELTPLEFIGRDRDLNNLSNLSRQAKIVLIKGGEGVGKSRLARQFLDTHFLKMIEIDIVLSSGEINLPTNALKQILIDDLNRVAR